jgi:hypothetical protein
MQTSNIMKFPILITAAMALVTMVEAKPLKVFILAGQSNMEGHAESYTFPAIAKDPKTADLYKQMVDAEGKPVVCKDVWISYAYGDFGGNPIGRKAGNLTAGWGSQHHNICKIGPEYTFGITMQKHLGEPILIIKNAWGGKSLMVDFRPPSGGEPSDPKHKENAGKYYGHMMSHVSDVLADPKKVYAGYNEKEGYEIAGFVWFQGFNDLVGPYPGDPTKKSIKDYSEYSRLLACLIRDLRKDLNTPKMPFVTGVLGVGGETTGDGAEAFRNAMAAPAEIDEFKGTVANVYTHKFWPADIEAIKSKVSTATAELSKQNNVLKMRAKKGEDVKEESAKLAAEIKEVSDKALSEDEKFLLKNGSSNQGFHYHGSAKFFAQTGKAFADELVGLKK